MITNAPHDQRDNNRAAKTINSEQCQLEIPNANNVTTNAPHEQRNNCRATARTGDRSPLHTNQLGTKRTYTNTQNKRESTPHTAERKPRSQNILTHNKAQTESHRTNEHTRSTQKPNTQTTDSTISPQNTPARNNNPTQSTTKQPRRITTTIHHIDLSDREQIWIDRDSSHAKRTITHDYNHDRDSQTTRAREGTARATKAVKRRLGAPRSTWLNRGRLVTIY